jgi:hypothetical protein
MPVVSNDFYRGLCFFSEAAESNKSVFGNRFFWAPENGLLRGNRLAKVADVTCPPPMKMNRK